MAHVADDAFAGELDDLFGERLLDAGDVGVRAALADEPDDFDALEALRQVFPDQHVLVVEAVGVFSELVGAGDQLAVDVAGRVVRQVLDGIADVEARRLSQRRHLGQVVAFAEEDPAFAVDAVAHFLFQPPAEDETQVEAAPVVVKSLFLADADQRILEGLVDVLDAVRIFLAQVCRSRAAIGLAEAGP